MLTLAGAPHYNVCREGCIKVLIGTVVKKNIWLPHFDRRNSDILIKHVHTIKFDSSVLRAIPHEAIILPVEGQPDVTCQDLILSSRPGQQLIG